MPPGTQPVSNNSRRGLLCVFGVSGTKRPPLLVSRSFARRKAQFESVLHKLPLRKVLMVPHDSTVKSVWECRK